MAVVCPFERAVIVGDGGIEKHAGRGLDYVDGIEFGALDVDGVSDQPVIGAVTDAGDAEISMRLRKGVAVDQNLLIAAGERSPAEDWMLAADHET